MQALLRVPVALYRPPAAAAYLRFYSVARSIATEEKSLQSKETREEPSAEAASLRFYDVARAMATEDGSLLSKETRAASLRIHHAALEKLYHHSRKQALLNSGEELYPRIHRASPTIAMSISKFFHTFEELSKDTIADEWDITFYGRVKSIRRLGQGLAFVDLAQTGYLAQGICSQGRIVGSGTSIDQFQDLFRKMQRGDIFSFRGLPYRDGRGKLSLLATELPQLCSPCLHQFPTVLEDQETRVQNRHLDLQVNQRAIQTLLLRSKIIRHMRDFLSAKGYIEVQTPILANLAGGAVARAFDTEAVEFPERHIQLRTAPELWLKRLVLGGLEKVFEIGQCFRNEGLDKTHNPEFTTCEFYCAYTGLKEMIEYSELLFIELIDRTKERFAEQLKSLPACTIDSTAPFRRLDFIPEIESAMNLQFPDLQSPDAEAEVIKMFQARDIPLPSSTRLPRLLDRLAAHYLEPQCQSPTWIIHHPECLSPLSKSFISPTNQRIAARAELFIGGKEIVNTYEEENSPFEQRRKFEMQAQYRDDDNRMDIDESYLEALEWGLPPTSGWGCGIDRLVMLLAGTDRINDVLTFGNLRNVISLGKSGRDSVRSSS